jgi:hypothetical protein
MKNPFTSAVVGVLVLMALLAGPVLSAESHSDPTFATTPRDPAKTYPKFHIGVSGIYATIEKGLRVTVDSTEPGTPAEGKLQKDDVLLKVNGKPVAEPEPYVALGNALTAAEADDSDLDADAAVFSAGGGVKYFIRDNVALAVNGSYLVATDDIFVDTDDGEVQGDEFRILFSVGFYFD